MQEQQPARLLCVDWDGVVCRSAKETGKAGLLTAAKLRDSQVPEDHVVEDLLEQFEVARPCLEVGWEAAIIMHALWARSLTPAVVLESFHSSLKDDIMKELELTEASAKQVFHDTRTSWMSSNKEAWLALHGFFEDTQQHLQRIIASDTNTKVAVITTKGKDFAAPLVQQASLAIPDEFIFGLEAGKKWDVLSSLLEEHPDATCIFVEDRLNTLLAVHERLGERVQLYLVDYGYNTPQQRQQAQEHPAITVISSFAQLPA
ncbi:hypothetical protein PTSG_01805 [Salpingoeca rosetta]|uniref:Uncharacterized protein n=1 Tax=Salpingoeca rosetta (strain ATCC 50818 / BSB-021) TaxID=946362 RepID=F2TZ05_SALR5|nr:uncharacterized protein PTSG_01805 [Salpingoeca rosetta]EGD78829.1 hypothetical protein PTSG_01805 [Salpingoeca rosetta]|eukprot:XP_004997785.1 hypothetical protein PTSG_01805 [Salpingoeca rosetta]